MSHSASALILVRSCFFCQSGRFSFSSSVTAEPEIAVSGVRRSCEIARSRFARIRSLSASSRIRSCRLSVAVSELTVSDTASIVKNVSGYPDREKLKSMYGYVKT